MISSPLLAEMDRLRHGFFGRQGGVSEGVFASLNCGFGSGDDPDRVSENRARAAALVGVAASGVLTAYQTHSARVASVERPWPRQQAPSVDAMVTRAPGMALGILTADCAPVLMADPQAGIIGAVHAGWRGALDGILEATLEVMSHQGAALDRMLVSIGPCILQASYEVGPEFRDRFIAAAAQNERFFRASKVRVGHFHFDLPGYIAARLATAGVACIEQTGRDTCAERDAFFSYRRNVLEGQRDYGRNLSLIALEG
jgi:YfiH family protein